MVGLIKLMVTVTLMLLSSCDKKNIKESSFLESNLNSLFSDRVDLKIPYQGVVQLKAPPLLEVSYIDENGVLQVSDKFKTMITLEQSRFEKTLASVGPDIKIIYKYRGILNGYALTGPMDQIKKIQELNLVSSINEMSYFSLPRGENIIFSDESLNKFKLIESNLPLLIQNELIKSNSLNVHQSSKKFFEEANSVKFIGAESFYAEGFKGKNIKVGIIDTGIDYTHQAFGGPGDENLYKQINVSESNSYFPNGKIVGGYDFVGSNFNPASLASSERVPVPDPNPIDEAGHGTHVAAIVAGLGDGVETYDGVAFESSLYALKVFGKHSTSDIAVLAALEYALDPNGDLEYSDRLDIVNLSLGSHFGGPTHLYTEAVKRLVHKSNMVVVAASGNSGRFRYITSSPASITEAISVAAVVDNSFHNWRQNGIEIDYGGGLGKSIVLGTIGQFSPEFNVFPNLTSEVFNLAYGGPDTPTELLDAVKGKIALIKRGNQITFNDKAKFAESAGAVAAIIYNDRVEDLGIMAGDNEVKIPVVYIAIEPGEKILEEVKKGNPVKVTLAPNIFIERKNIIDTVTSFSSQGPRSEDLAIKPEIGAPGNNVQAALMGGGKKGIQLSGTSMATPHVAGAAALIKQKYPHLTALEIKALLLNSGKTLQHKDKKEMDYVSAQGSGRIQLEQIAKVSGYISPATLSLGLVQVDEKKQIRIPLEYVNLSDKAALMTLNLKSRFQSSLNIKKPHTLAVGAKEKKTLFVDLDLDATQLKSGQEIDGWIEFIERNGVTLNVPFLFVLNKVSAIQSDGPLRVFSDQIASAQAAAELKLINSSKQSGDVYLFNHLGSDLRKSDSVPHLNRSKNCDVQSVGYRIQNNIKGEEILQIGVKLYNPVSSWARCQVVALFDQTGDKVEDQELAYMAAMHFVGNILGPNAAPLDMASVLLNSNRIKYIKREAFHKSDMLGRNAAPVNYNSAIQDVQSGIGIAPSTVVILETRTQLIKRNEFGEVFLKVASQDYSGMPAESDDILDIGDQGWVKFSLEPEMQSFMNLPPVVSVSSLSSVDVPLIKGYGKSDLLALYPMNKTHYSYVMEDNQMEQLSPQFNKD